MLNRHNSAHFQSYASIDEVLPARSELIRFKINTTKKRELLVLSKIFAAIYKQCRRIPEVGERLGGILLFKDKNL